MKFRSYSKGAILWVEDSITFNDDADRGQAMNSDDAWRVAFGTLDNRIYRLMDLSLIVVSNRDDAIKVVDEFMLAENRHIYLQAVVDLRIPETSNSTEEHVKHGVDVAKYLQQKIFNSI
jgi:hypothetical protein